MTPIVCDGFIACNAHDISTGCQCDLEQIMTGFGTGIPSIAIIVPDPITGFVIDLQGIILHVGGEVNGQFHVLCQSKLEKVHAVVHCDLTTDLLVGDDPLGGCGGVVGLNFVGVGVDIVDTQCVGAGGMSPVKIEIFITGDLDVIFAGDQMHGKAQMLHQGGGIPIIVVIEPNAVSVLVIQSNGRPRHFCGQVDRQQTRCGKRDLEEVAVVVDCDLTVYAAV